MKFSAALAGVSCSLFVHCGVASGGAERSRCEYSDGAASEYVAIRGTGYYWLEWVGRGERGALLLVEGERPLFADRAEVSNGLLKCSEERIVAELQIERIGTRLVYDCHLTDDEPDPIGELVVGFIDAAGPGLVKPLAAWQVVVLGKGEGGEIRPVDASRVLCTVLPPIDG